MNKVFLVISTLLLLGFFSCNKAEKPPIKKDKIWDCHHEETWDAFKIKNSLIGEWEWEFISCWANQEDANSNEFIGLTIEFKSDSTLLVKEDGQLAQTSNWKVVEGDGDLFAIEATPSIRQLNGRILIGDDRVLFNDSYIDGCDNYFKRK
jgi:hypothetical protein